MAQMAHRKQRAKERRHNPTVNSSEALESRHDQRTICAAPRASGRPCPLHDPAGSAAQIARSSRTPLNCAAVAVGFRPRLGPRRCATAPSAPQFPPLYAYAPLPAVRPQTEASSSAVGTDVGGGTRRPASFNFEVNPGQSVGTLFSMKSLGELSVADLRRVIALKEQIESLEGRLEAIAGETGVGAASATEAPVPAKPPKRRLSAAHRRKLIKALAKARKIRWAKARSTGSDAVPKRRRMSAAGRAAISAAAKARWAKVRANNPH